MRRLIFLSLAACLAVGTAQAQVLGTLQGYVTDEQGGVLPGSSVTIQNTETGRTREEVTNAEGFYTAPSLSPGVYTITASLQGLQPTTREGIKLLVGQVLDVALTLRLSAVTEEITVTAESPIIEVSRSSAAHYVSEEEINQLPIIGRNYVNFALLAPTVKVESVRGGVSFAGQKGISSGLNIDGTEGKSAFFGYGRGGEATENEGVVIAQESVREFQVVTNGYAPEYGRSGGGYINVVTKSGTNTLQGSAFGFFRNDALTANSHITPFEEQVQGIDPNDDRFEAGEFKRYNWGASLGGPIVEDRTHFFLSYDQTSRTSPTIRNIQQPGVYDAMLLRFPSLVDGYVPNNDGVAEAIDPGGRTASGEFTNDISNVVLFGKITHQLNDSNTVSFRYNFTDYERVSDDKFSESLKTEKTHSMVVSLVSVFGSNVVNEFRFQYAKDDVSREANLAATDPEALMRIDTSAGQAQIGRPDFLPIFINEKKFQIRDDLAYSFGHHDLKFGVDFNRDDLSEFFAGSNAGRYDFRSVSDFVNDNARRTRIWFGTVDQPNPNFDVSQTTLGLYAQDAWRPSSKLTVNVGVRWEGTFNPNELAHAIPEGQEIADDLNNLAPRLGFTYSSDDNKSVVRGGVGLFHSRTPTLIFADQILSNGIAPNFGRLTVSPGQNGFVPLGVPIDNNNPPPGIVPAVSYSPSSFEDPETWRANLGYEREFAPNWSAGIDLAWAKTSHLQGQYDQNTFAATLDGEGRYVYPSGRPDPNFGQIKLVTDLGRSTYYAATFRVAKRFSDGFQVNAHYTWSQDKDTDSNERSATGLTMTNGLDPEHDFGFSERDVAHRFVVSGMVKLPLEFQLSGILTLQSGTPYTARDDRFNMANHPGFTVADRAVIGGRLSERNAFRNPGYQNFDVRLTRLFSVDKVKFEIIAEAFNLFDTKNFSLGTGDFTGPGGIYISRDGEVNPNFGIEDSRGAPRQFQLGARLTF